MTAAGKSYFRYHLRSMCKLFLFILAVSLVMTVINSSVQKQIIDFFDYEIGESYKKIFYFSNIDMFAGLMLIIVSVLPIIEFVTFKKRRNLDCYYGLPITRRLMGMIHYITGLICVIVCYSCCYFVNFLFMLRYPEAFDYMPMLGHYFLSLAIGICLYSLNVFIFNQANSTVDGIIFLVAWNFLFGLLGETWNSILRIIFDISHFYGVNLYEMQFKLGLLYTNMGVSWGVLDEIAYEYDRVITKEAVHDLCWLWNDPECLVWLLLWAIVGIAAVFGFVYTFERRKIEKTGEISDSWFGYKLMIPLLVSIGIIMSEAYGMLGYIILAFVAYIVYRKGFHLKKSDWISLGVIFIFGVMISMICQGTLLGAYYQ